VTRVSYKTGFTLVEILIAAVVLSLFMTGLFSLYRGGSNLSNSTIWAQQTINQLKLACREINTSLKKSTYPSSITFPGQITDNTAADFAVHFFNGTIMSTQTTGITTAGINGAKILALTESTPGKSGFAAADNTDAVLIYHIFTLDNRGQLTLSRWRENVAGNMIGALTRPSTPPGSAVREFQTVIARDVESVEIAPTSPTNPKSPLLVRINCKIPRGNTTRSEQAVGTPNVAIISHTTIGGW